MFFKQIVDEKLAQYAYLVGCQRTREALLIDPQRDIDRYVRIARHEGLRITAVTETHIHADFLSGCREFVERRGCEAFLSAEGGPDWQYAWARGHDGVTLLRDGDRFTVGGIDFQDGTHARPHTRACELPDHGPGLRSRRADGDGLGRLRLRGRPGAAGPARIRGGPNGRNGALGAASLRLGARGLRTARLPAHLARPRGRQRLRQGARRGPGHDGRVRKAIQPRAGGGEGTARMPSSSTFSRASPNHRSTSAA